MTTDTHHDNENNADIILVVDDSPETLSMINDTLEQAGLNVLVALEGKQAIAIAQRLRPDIILLDAIMPNMDGFETCRQLKSENHLSAIPVIFMTGLTDTNSVVKGLEAGGVDYLTKPVKPEELLARIKVHLKNARLTNSAYQALDSTGQYLFTCRQDGTILWATPQAHALFAKAKADDDWKKNVLSQQLALWLKHNPALNQSTGLSGLTYPLEAVMVDRGNGEEILFKLVDGQKDAGENILKEKLRLTSRESQVLFWLAKGKTNREVAQILEMSPRTVNKHLEQIYPKLGVENRTSAAAIAIGTLSPFNVL